MNTEQRFHRAIRAFLQLEQTAQRAKEVIASARRLHRQCRRRRLYVGLCNPEPESLNDAFLFHSAFNAHLLETERENQNS